jgi:endonuclease/exonuclease/phosphatase family metal-dependent hydrolase
MKKSIKFNKSGKKYSKNNKNSKRTKSKLNNKNKNKNKNNNKIASKLYGGTQTKITFNMLSWNIFFGLFKFEYSNKPEVELRLHNYFIENADILFVQETPYKLLLDNYTCISSDYDNGSKNAPAGISINFNNNVFEIVDANKIVRGTFSEQTFVIGDIIISNEKEYTKKSDDDAIPTNRPILAVKLKHIQTGKNIIFVNLWAAHHIVKNKEDVNFLVYLSKIIIECGYVTGEHIIIAGDFNEYSTQTYFRNSNIYKNSNQIAYDYKTEYTTDIKKNAIENITLILNNKAITLDSKQKRISCCGDLGKSSKDTLKKLNLTKSDQYLIGPEDEKMIGYWNTDLLFTDLNADVKVDYQQKLSDHFPVIANITLEEIEEL